jgi:nicotinamide-nucleotide amidase
MDEDSEAIAQRAAETLRDAGATVAVAEAATGGLVATLLTGPPGASDYFDRGYVTYAYDSLREELAVSRETLDEHGAVSGPTVAAMAQAARDRARTDYGVATAAVAGPGGGTDERPVGTAFVAVATAEPWGSEASGVTVERHEFDGDRSAVREQVAKQALGDLAAAVQATE